MNKKPLLRKLCVLKQFIAPSQVLINGGIFFGRCDITHFNISCCVQQDINNRIFEIFYGGNFHGLRKSEWDERDHCRVFHKGCQG